MASSAASTLKTPWLRSSRLKKLTEYINKFKKISSPKIQTPITPNKTITSITDSEKLPIDINYYLLQSFINYINSLYDSNQLTFEIINYDESKFSFTYKFAGDIIFLIEVEVINRLTGETMITKSRIKDFQIERKNTIYSNINDLYQFEEIVKTTCTKIIVL